MIAAVPKAEAPRASADVAELIDLVHEVFQGSLRRLHPTLAKERITMGQFWAIHSVSSLEGASLSSVARYLGVASPTVCANIDQLEQAGLVKRQRSEKDRRNVEITLTPRGRKVEHRVWRAIAQVMSEAGRDVSESDLAASIRVFREVAGQLDLRPGAYREGP